MESEQAGRPLLERAIEIGCRLGQKIECPAVVLEDDRHLLAHDAEGYVDAGGANMAELAVLHQVGEELLDEDRDARLLRIQRRSGARAARHPCRRED